MSNSQKIVIKAIKKERWGGFLRYPKCQEAIMAAHGRGGYDVGIDEKTRRHLENALQLKVGDLDAHSKFWVSYNVRVTDKDLELDLSRPRDLLDYYVLRSSNRVAPSVNDLLQFPKADYVIYDAEEEARKENLKVRAKTEAYKKYTSMTPQDMRDALKLMGKRVTDMSSTVVENILNRMVEEEPMEFNRVVNLPNYKLRVLVSDLTGANILRINGGHYFFGDTPLGHDLETTLVYLDDPKNQDLLLSLKSKLKATAKA
jgi:hypothetical protein